jgi:hypothetical protein
MRLLCKDCVYLALFFSFFTISVNAQISSHQIDSLESKHVIPNFSYAGYRNGEFALPRPNYKVFNVIDFGAIPNDTLSDKLAIEKAIEVAEKNGSGIVFFPAGRFLVNEDVDTKTTIRVNNSKIILRGSGSGLGGTELFMKNTLLPRNVNEMWSTPPMFEFGRYQVSKLIGTISKNAFEGSNQITVTNANKFKVSDWIQLSLNAKDTNLLREEIGNHSINPNWHAILDKEGMIIREYHQVKSIKGNIITLNSPIGYNIANSQQWKVYLYQPNQEIGVENIAFVGNFTHPFVHHRSWQDDSGWNLFHFNGVVNSWIKDCRFTNVSIGVMVRNSAQVSVLNCILSGNGTHEAIQANRSTNVLIGKCVDSAGMFHSIGVDGYTMNTVIWRCRYLPTTSFESHSYQPRNTLLDNVEGGLLPNHAGGAEENHPNHLKGLVFWNYKRTDTQKELIDFWPDNQIYGGRISPMVIVGLHGKPTKFIEGQYKLLVANGTVVKPQSLYAYQLHKRLGYLPKWFTDLDN